MARRVPVHEEATPPAEVRSNPDLLGEDLARLGWMAVGLVATALVNDKLVHPVVQQVFPQLKAGGTAGKIADSATTFGTAYLVGEAVGMVAGDRTGRNMKIGGMVLGTGKAISVAVPNFSISAKYPEIGAAKAPAVAPAPASSNGKVVQLPQAKPAPVGVEAI